jgi:hypothetical protein
MKIFGFALMVLGVYVFYLGGTHKLDKIYANMLGEK